MRKKYKFLNSKGIVLQILDLILKGYRKQQVVVLLKLCYNYFEVNQRGYVMNIAICDDDKVFREKIKTQLIDVEFFKDSDYVFCQTGEELLEAYNPQNPFDFVFLDVDMPKMNGLEAGEKINKLSPKTIIIFVSSYPQYAIDAFDCNATSYLLKGSDQEKFNKTIEKAIYKYKNLNTQICLKTGAGITNLKPDELFYIEYSEKYCHYHTANEVYSVRQPLMEALKDLAPFGFIQTYQCYVTNLSKIKKIQSSSVILVNDTELPIKRGTSKDLIKEYTNYMNTRL